MCSRLATTDLPGVTASRAGSTVWVCWCGSPIPYQRCLMFLGLGGSPPGLHRRQQPNGLSMIALAAYFDRRRAQLWPGVAPPDQRSAFCRAALETRLGSLGWLVVASCSHACVLLMPVHAAGPPDTLEVTQAMTAPAKGGEKKALPQAFPMEEFLDRLMGSRIRRAPGREEPAFDGSGPLSIHRIHIPLRKRMAASGPTRKARRTLTRGRRQALVLEGRNEIIGIDASGSAREGHIGPEGEDLLPGALAMASFPSAASATTTYFVRFATSDGKYLFTTCVTFQEGPNPFTDNFVVIGD